MSATTTETTTNGTSNTPNVSVPPNYTKRGGDVVGTFNPEGDKKDGGEYGVIHCIPKGVKLFDGQLDAKKPSTLIICELVEPCSSVANKEGRVKTKKGDLVGIFYKPGMSAIETLCGEPCIIRYELDKKGNIVTKDMGKKGMNPMKCFDVLSENNPAKKIPVISDSRKMSAEVNTLFAPAKTLTPATAADDESESFKSDQDIPF